MNSRIATKYFQLFRAQFGRPTGFWGRVAGMIMAYSNRERSRWVISLLHIKPNDRVLEIGFGPGSAVEQVSRIVTDGFIAGIDHSEVMLRQAQKRNAKAIRESRVDLRLASVSDLPTFNKPFDKIFSINSIQFWDDPIKHLKEIIKLLKPEGLIAIALQPRNPGATDGDAQRMGGEIAAYLETAGFSKVRVETRQMNPVSAVCVLGVNKADKTFK